ncbi:DUF3817 domain-containing protein [Mycobacterium sp. MYCO198283]|uniref:DUF3817 domain-containing protein n=1 Tax=Mycobacterium sp. MYCO198283 TaxID=2883505 RepID=UPI001E4F0C1C|nr:DUF3817 domain-containing protein [Mycobacterium sp. MYCO198283]MCG5434466.1 DUF3817 domain-containing protein [Mycobacterium sp. MYCO198283]
MTSSLDVRSAAGRFRLVALLEAGSWAGLLIGMYFKYAGEPRTEVGVKIFGPVHGALFLAFVLTAAAVGTACRWTVSTWLLALLASIAPLCSVIFLIWADRSGRLASAAGSGAAQPRGDVPNLTS